MHMDLTNTAKAASQMPPQWLSWHTHTHSKQLNLPQYYSYSRPDDQANCVPLFDGTCCVFVSRMVLFMDGCLLLVVWKATAAELTERTEGDLMVTCSYVRVDLLKSLCSIADVYFCCFNAVVYVLGILKSACLCPCKAG